MTITKYGHSCLLIETAGTKILTDVGSWNETPDATGVNAIVITHEHGDHFDLEKIKTVLAHNPDAVVVTHAAVAKLLEEEVIQTITIEPGQRIEVNGVSIESYGTEHAIIYGPASPCRNTGFLIADTLFIPGDALHDVPPKPVPVLALPTGGPWMKIAEAIDYAKAVNPKVVFPIHDALYTQEVREGMVPRIIGGNLEPAGIQFVNMSNGETKEFAA